MIPTVMLCLFLCEISVARQGVFPLQVGNTWQYGGEGSSDWYVQDKIIGDTLLSNGKQYKVLQRTNRNGPSAYFSYYRVDSNKVYSYQPPNDSDEVLCLEFGRNLGDTILMVPDIQYPGFYKRVVVYGGASIQSVFGITRTTHFFHTTFHDYFFWDAWVAESLGIIKFMSGCLYTCPPDFEKLTGAIISGVRYGTITSVGNDNFPLPKDFELLQNYPNPFNPLTVVSFQLPISSLVTLKVYNVLGQQFAELIHNELMDEGVQDVEFDASNLSSGAYYYRIVAEDVDGKGILYSTVKKMLMIK